MTRRLLGAACTLLLWTVVAGPVEAQLSPGPLSRVHSEMEGMTHCTSCHALGKGVDPDKCLECHEPIRERLTSSRGLHGRNGWSRCSDCHRDHHGETFELIHWEEGGPEALRHEETGFSLRGKHADLACRQCHRAANVVEAGPLRARGKDLDRTYLGLGTECTDCHEDKHRPTLGTCNGCHDETSWKPAPGFDHRKTAYPLDGKHVGVDCARCHAPAPTSFAPVEHGLCSDCHKDPHRGDLGADCARCHSTVGWSEVRVSDFDHGKTRFPLRGRHVSVNCRTCHASGRPVSGRLACFQCHADPHVDQFSMPAEARSSCGGCHREQGFLPATYGIREHGETDYPLTGSHLAVPCTSCHRSPDGTRIYRWDSLDCAGCHADPHAGTFRAAVRPVGPCGSCHGTDAWNSVDFAHDAVDFPLEGKHADASCAGCHDPRSEVRNAATMNLQATVAVSADRGPGRAGATGSRSTELRFTGAPDECAACHSDPHAGQFRLAIAASPGASAGGDCVRCHTTADWAPKKFDHDVDSRFRLEGAHAKVPCAACHHVNAEGVRVFRPLVTECISCHATPPREAP